MSYSAPGGILQLTRLISRSSVAVFISLIMALTSGWLIPAYASNTNNISGQLIDSQTQLPLGDAYVTLYDSSDNYVDSTMVPPISDESTGVFNFEGLNPGVYKLSISPQGIRDGSVQLYQSKHNISVEIPAGVDNQTVEVDISLNPYSRGSDQDTLQITPEYFTTSIPGDWLNAGISISLYCELSDEPSQYYYIYSNIANVSTAPIVFRNMPESNCQVSAYIDGPYFVTEASVDVGGGPKELELKFKKLSGASNVSGRVVKEDSPSQGLGAGGINLSYSEQYAPGAYFKYNIYSDVDENGNFDFGDKIVPPGAAETYIRIDSAINGYPRSERKQIVIPSNNSNLIIPVTGLGVGTTSISVSVVDLEDNPIPETTIDVQAYDESRRVWIPYGQLTTDSNGFLLLPNLPNFIYQLEFSKEGYQTSLRQIHDLESGETRTLEVGLFQTSELTLSGEITDSETGQPLENVHVFVYYSTRGDIFSWSQSVQTDSMGQYSFDNVVDTNLKLSVSPQDDVPYFSTPTISLSMNGQSKVVNVQLEPYPTGESTLTGVINTLDPTPQQPGRKVLTANVSIYLHCVDTKNRSFRENTSTDANGEYLFQDLPQLADCRIRTYKDGLLDWNTPWRERFSVNGLEPITKNIDLVKSGSLRISGTLRDSVTGLPVSGIYVSGEYSEQGSTWNNGARTASNGTFTIEGAISGKPIKLTYGIPDNRAYFSNYNKPTVVTLSGADLTGVNLTIEPHPVGTSRITGTVTYKDSNLANAPAVALENTLVSLNCTAGTDKNLFYTTRTNSSGNYSFTRLGAISCRVSIDSDERFLEWDSWSNRSVLDGTNSVVRNIALQTKGNAVIQGKVLDSNNLPVVNQRVSFYYNGPNDSYYGGSTTTDEEGNYRLEKIPTTRMGGRLGVYVSNYDENDNQIFIDPESYRTLPAAGATVNHDFIVTRIADIPAIQEANLTVSGNIVNDDDGTPIANVRINVSFNVDAPVSDGQGGFRTESVYLYYRAETDESGNYSISGLPSNTRASVSIWHSGEEGEQVFQGQYTNLELESSSRVQDFSLVPLPTGTGSISGTLFDDLGNPISNAWVSVSLIGFDDFYRSALTDANGKYVIDRLPKGTFRMSAYAEGTGEQGRRIYKPLDYDAFRKELATSSTVATNYNLTLERYRTGNVTVTGQLWNRTDDLPLAGVEVWVYSNTDSDVPSLYAVTDEQGVWTLENVPDATYVISYDSIGDNFTRPNRRVFEVTSSTLSGTPPTLDLSETSRDYSDRLILTESSVEVSVYDTETYKPVSGATVYLSHRSANQSFTTLSSSNGIASFPNVPSGDYYVSVSKPGYWSAYEDSTKKIAVGKNVIRLATKNLNATGTISGRITDQWGNGISGARVSISYGGFGNYWAGDGGYYVSAETGVNGSYELLNVPQGFEMTFNVNPPEPDNGLPQFTRHESSIELDLSLDSGGVAIPQTLNKNVSLRLGGTIAGRVVDSSGKSVSDISIEARDNSTGEVLGWGYTDENGNYLIRGIKPSNNVIISMYDWNTSRTGGTYAYGFWKSTGVTTGRLEPEQEDAETVIVTSRSRVNLENTIVRAGNGLSGKVSVNVGAELSDDFYRSIEVRALRKVGSSYQEAPVGYWTSGWEAGRFRVYGLPDGEYILQISEPYRVVGAIETVFLGANGQFSSLEDVEPFNLTGGEYERNLSASVSVPRPENDPVSVSRSDLDPELRDQIIVDQVVSPGTSVEVNVGIENAGSWIAATTIAPTEVTPASNPIALSSNHSVASFTQTSSGETVTTTDWVQVGPDGIVMLPGLTNPGVMTIAIKDSNNKVMGWTEVSFSNQPSQGSPGVAVPEVSIKPPTLISPPKIRGVARVGSKLIAFPGKWDSATELNIKYQWYRCENPTKAKAKVNAAANCKPIVGKTKSSYKVLSKDKKSYLTVRVSVSNGGKQVRFFAKSVLAKKRKSLSQASIGPMRDAILLR